MEENRELTNVEENTENPGTDLTEFEDSEATISVGKVFLVGTAIAAAVYGVRKLWNHHKNKKAGKEAEEEIIDVEDEDGFKEVTEEDQQ